MSRDRTLRDRWIGAALALALGLTALSGCSDPPQPDGELVRPGTGAFTLPDAAAGEDLRVYYAAPEDDLPTARILIVMAGTGRNAADYRDAWAEAATADNLVVLAPEFDAEQFPGDTYNLGGMLDADGQLTPSSEWLFGAINILFAAAVDDLNSNQSGFDMFGHSAGAQFVHRYVEFAAGASLQTAVAANAGWYTTVDDGVEFPFGLRGAPRSESEMAPALGMDLVVLLGTADNDPDAESLRRDDETDRQGTTRLQRGRNFYAGAQAAADRIGAEFVWLLREVPGVDHDYVRMSAAAGDLLYG